MAKANKLQEAIDKLHEADALMQEALGHSDECFDLHCAIESVADDIAGYAEQLVEMQVTE
jgi:hypothetical protein